MRKFYLLSQVSKMIPSTHEKVPTPSWVLKTTPITERVHATVLTGIDNDTQHKNAIQ